MRIIKAQQTNLNNSHIYKRQWLLSVCCCVLLRKFILRLPIWKSSGLELPKLKVLLRVTRDILGVSSVLGINDLLFLGVCFGGDGWRFGHDLQNFLILRIFNLKPFPCTVNWLSIPILFISLHIHSTIWDSCTNLQRKFGGSLTLNALPFPIPNTPLYIQNGDRLSLPDISESL